MEHNGTFIGCLLLNGLYSVQLFHVTLRVVQSVLKCVILMLEIPQSLIISHDFYQLRCYQYITFLNNNFALKYWETKTYLVRMQFCNKIHSYLGEARGKLILSR